MYIVTSSEELVMKLVKKNNCEYWVNDKGQYHGEYKEWDSDSQLEEHCFFVNGELHGDYKWWRKDGTLEEHSFYVNGKRHGEYKWWYENGQLEQHCFFVNGRYHGEFKSWWRNGQIRAHCFFVNGKIVRSLIDYPVTDEDKFLLALEFGGKWLDINS